EPIPEPLLIIHGGIDEQIPVASSQLLFSQLCNIGQAEQRWVYPDQSHAGVIAPSLNDMLAWIGQRFAGNPNPFPITPVGPPVPACGASWASLSARRRAGARGRGSSPPSPPGAPSPAAAARTWGRSAAGRTRGGRGGRRGCPVRTRTRCSRRRRPRPWCSVAG